MAKRRSHKKKSYRRNPFRRRGRSKRYRRNPPEMKSVLYDVGYGAVGVVATSIASRFASQAMPALLTQAGYVGIAVNVGIAYAAALLGEKFLGSRAFTPMFIGGAATAIRTLVTSVAPAGLLGPPAMGYPALAGPAGSGSGVGFYRRQQQIM